MTKKDPAQNRLDPRENPMNHCYPFINTPLPYGYDALEPFIDEKTMHLHHDKHLQAYIDNLNKLLKDAPTLQSFSLEELISCCLPVPRHLQISIRNNAGGVYNHQFYFAGMKPNCRYGRRGPDAREKGCGRKNPAACSLFDAMSRQFGSREIFQTQFKEAALSVFGSGYAWLVAENGRLKITTSANQDTPLSKGRRPILNIDVWEHAYYLKHYNVRAAYIDDWFHVINWSAAQEHFDELSHYRK